MRPWIAGFALALTLLLSVARMASAEDPVITNLEVETTGVVTVGDRITYTVTLEADPGVELSVDQSSLSPLVELVGTPESSVTPLDGDRERVRFSFRLAAFAPGPLDLPPITLRYTANDTPGGELATGPTRLFITSVLPAEPRIPPPRDLKPQAVIGQPPAVWPTYALIGAVVTLAVLLLAIYVRIRLRRRRARRATAAAAAISDQPEDRARTVLDTAGAGFGLEGNYVDYYSAIGVTVRQYLTDRYGFPAFALTTRELESEMLKRGLDRWQVRVASGLLQQCDAVVYANYRPAAERADADLTAAYEIVEMSRPVPEPEEVAP